MFNVKVNVWNRFYVQLWNSHLHNRVCSVVKGHFVEIADWCEYIKQLRLYLYVSYLISMMAVACGSKHCLYFKKVWSNTVFYLVNLRFIASILQGCIYGSYALSTLNKNH